MFIKLSSNILKALIVRYISVFTADFETNLPSQRAVTSNLVGRFKYNREGPVLDCKKRRVGNWLVDIEVDIRINYDTVRWAFAQTNPNSNPPAIAQTNGDSNPPAVAQTDGDSNPPTVVKTDGDMPKNHGSQD